MAKIIKYQFATEYLCDVIVDVPLLDEDGNPVMEEIVIPVTEEVAVPILDENGKPILDVNGEPITEVVVQPVYDENGEPVVEITYEPVMVKGIEQEVKTILSDKAIKCSTEASFQANLPIAEKEAYNGEYTVEDDGEPEPVVQETADDVLNALLGVTV